MTRAQEWMTDLGWGDRWSDGVVFWWRGHGGCWSRATDAEQRQGIDWVMVDNQGRRFRVEIKTQDLSRAERFGGGFAVETIKDLATGAPGWLYTTQADWLLFVSPQDRGFDLFRVHPEKLRKQVNKSDFDAFVTVSKRGASGAQWSSEAVRVPLVDLMLSTIERVQVSYGSG